MMVWGTGSSIHTILGVHKDHRDSLGYQDAHDKDGGKHGAE